MRTLFQILFVFALGLGGPTTRLAVADPSFNAGSEFPNFFLPEQYRGQDPADVPDEVVADAQAKLEKALQSVFSRLTIPVVTHGSKEVAMVPYFSHLNAAVRQVDPTATVMPSGGVVRSALGYVYNAILEGTKLNPPRTPEETLKLLIASKDPIPGYAIRGVGSDFDILLRGDKSKQAEVIKVATDITNSAEAAFGMRNFRSDLKRSLFTIGDVKNYDEQIDRSTKQGGSTLDFLAYDVEKGGFVLPSRYRNIITDFIRGTYSYVAPEKASDVEDAPKQTIRGIRALIELPWLRMHDDSQLRTELEQLLEDVERGKIPTEKALSQFDKTVRNARYSGGHNRIYRGAQGSIEELIYRVAQKIEAKTDRPTIPEFVDAFPVSNRTAEKAELNGLPKSLLLSMDDFVRLHTDSGKLYHGTPQLESGLAIMRNSLFISKTDGKIQGKGTTTAAFGRGAYSSKHKLTAQSYAGGAGIVFELGIDPSKPLNILDWKKAQNDPALKKIMEKAASEGRDVFEVLARDHGIDIIINEHVLIQNINAVNLPNDFRGLINSYASLIDNRQSAPRSRIEAYLTHQRLHQYAQALGEGNLRPPLKISELTKELLDSSQQSGVSQVDTLKVILRNPLFVEELKHELPQAKGLKSRIRQLFDEISRQDPHAITYFPWSLSDPIDVQKLGSYLQNFPKDAEQILQQQRALITELGHRFPHLYKTQGPGRLDESTLSAASIPDQALRSQWIDLEKQEVLLRTYQSLFSDLMQDDPYAFIKTFPGFSAHVLGSFNVDRANGQIALSNRDRQVTALVEEVNRLSEKIGKQRRSLTQRELQLVRLLVQQENAEAIRFLIAQEGRGLNQIVNILKTDGHPGLILELLGKSSRADIDIGKLLGEQIQKDAKWKSELRAYTTGKNAFYREVGNFPWSLSDPEDVRTIARLSKQADAIRETLKQVQLKLRFDEKLGSLNWSGHYDLNQIRDEKLRDEYRHAFIQSTLSKEVAPKVLERWHKENPKAFATAFPKSPLLKERLKLPDWRDEEWVSLVKKWNEKGFASLEDAQQARINELLKQSIESDSTTFFQHLIQSGEKTKSAASKRLLTQRAGDDVTRIAELLNRIYPKGAEDISYKRFKNRLREHLMKRTAAGTDRSLSSGVYVWQIADEQDVQWMKELLSKNPIGAYELHQEEGHALATRIQKVDPGARVHEYDIEEFNGNSLPDAELSQQLANWQNKYHLRMGMERALTAMYQQDPRAFVAHFPDPRLRKTFLSSSKIWGEDKFTFSLYSGMEGHDQSLLPVLNKLVAKQELTPEDMFWYRELFLVDPSKTVKLSLNGRPEWKRFALELIKSPENADTVLSLLDSKTVPILTREIQKDAKWKSDLRQAILKDPTGLMVRAYPFELSDPADVVLIKTMQGRAEGSRQRLLALRREIKQRDGIGFHPQSPNYLEASRIIDPELREAFILAKQDFEYKSHLESIAESLHKSQPRLFKREFPNSELNQKAVDFGVMGDIATRNAHVQTWNTQGLNNLTPEAVKALRRIRLSPVRDDTLNFYRSLLATKGAARSWAIARLLQNRSDDNPGTLAALLTGHTDILTEAVARPAYRNLKDRLRTEAQAQWDAARYNGDVLSEYPWDLSDPEDVKLFNNVRLWDHQDTYSEEARLETHLTLTQSDLVRFSYSHTRPPTGVTEREAFFRGLLITLEKNQFRSNGGNLDQYIQRILSKDADHYVKIGEEDRWSGTQEARKLESNCRNNLAEGIAKLILSNPNKYGRFSPSRVDYSQISNSEILDRTARETALNLDDLKTRRSISTRVRSDAYQSNPLRFAELFPNEVPASVNLSYRFEDGKRKYTGGPPEVLALVNRALTEPLGNFTEAERNLIWILARAEKTLLHQIVQEGHRSFRLFFIGKVRQMGPGAAIDYSHEPKASSETTRSNFAYAVRSAIAADPKWHSEVRDAIMRGDLDWDAHKKFLWNLNDPEDVRILQANYGKVRERREEALSILREIRRHEGIHFEDHEIEYFAPSQILDRKLKSDFLRARANYFLSRSSDMEAILKEAGATAQDLLNRKPAPVRSDWAERCHEALIQLN